MIEQIMTQTMESINRHFSYLEKERRSIDRERECLEPIQNLSKNEAEWSRYSNTFERFNDGSEEDRPALWEAAAAAEANNLVAQLAAKTRRVCERLGPRAGHFEAM